MLALGTAFQVGDVIHRDDTWLNVEDNTLRLLLCVPRCRTPDAYHAKIARERQRIEGL